MSILVWPDVGSRLLIHLGRWRAPSARKPPFHQGVRRSQLSRPRWDSRCRAPASPSRKSFPTPGRRAFLKPQGGKVGSWAVDSHSAMFSKPSRATTIPLFMRPSRSGIQEPCVRDLYHLSMRVSSPWPLPSPCERPTQAWGGDRGCREERQTVVSDIKPHTLTNACNVFLCD